MRPLWPGLLLIVLYNAAFWLFLLCRPGGTAMLEPVDESFSIGGPLLGTLLCCLPLGWIGTWRLSNVWKTLFWPALFLGLGILADDAGEVLWAYYRIIHQQPFPSWADAAYLSSYPLLLGGILLLPLRSAPAAARTRIALDGLMIMTAVVTFSWYFVLGPTIVQGGETLLAKVIGTAYPLFDIVLVLCMLLLWSRPGGRALRPVIALLTVSLLVIVVADGAFDHLTLHNAYSDGNLIDPLWTTGYMILGLGGRALRAIMSRDAQEKGDVSATEESTAIAPLWRALLAYALVPAVGLLILYVLRTHGDEALQPEVYAGGALLLALVFGRQIMALVENRRLYHQIASKNRALEQANARLQALATTDPLTGSPNHRALVGALDHELERAYRYGRPCAVLFLDIDHFKSLNDTYGHAAGDAALRDFATVVSATVRTVDIVGRWGGEEFVAILPETDEDQALQLAERVRVGVASHVFAGGSGLHLTCSIGVASYPLDGGTRDRVLAAADQAMYTAKKLGRNQVRGASDPAVQELIAAEQSGQSREEGALAGTVEALAALVETRHQYTGEHTRDVVHLTTRIARVLGLDAAETRMLGVAARLHDVGKVGIPDAILQKPDPLNEREWALMRLHPAMGADVVSRVPALRPVAPLVRAHHERWDGGGYPDGLAGEAIPLGARIIAVADAYIAMTTDRPYRQARSSVRALDDLRRCSGTQFDPQVVAAMEEVIAADVPAAAHAS